MKASLKKVQKFKIMISLLLKLFHQGDLFCLFKHPTFIQYHALPSSKSFDPIIKSWTVYYFLKKAYLDALKGPK